LRLGISLRSHIAGRLPIMTTRKRREKLELGSSKLDQIFRTARRIYQLPVSPCANQMKHPTKCLVRRITGCAVKRRWSTAGVSPPGTWFPPPVRNQIRSGGNETAKASGAESR